MHNSTPLGKRSGTPMRAKTRLSINKAVLKRYKVESFKDLPNWLLQALYFGVVTKRTAFGFHPTKAR